MSTKREYENDSESEDDYSSSDDSSSNSSDDSGNSSENDKPNAKRAKTANNSGKQEVKTKKPVVKRQLAPLKAKGTPSGVIPKLAVGLKRFALNSSHWPTQQQAAQGVDGFGKLTAQNVQDLLDKGYTVVKNVVPAAKAAELADKFWCAKNAFCFGFYFVHCCVCVWT